MQGNKMKTCQTITAKCNTNNSEAIALTVYTAIDPPLSPRQFAYYARLAPPLLYSSRYAEIAFH